MHARPATVVFGLFWIGRVRGLGCPDSSGGCRCRADYRTPDEAGGLLASGMCVGLGLTAHCAHGVTIEGGADSSRSRPLADPSTTDHGHEIGSVVRIYDHPRGPLMRIRSRFRYGQSSWKLLIEDYDDA